MDSRLPVDVFQLFTEYLRRLQHLLLERIVGCYLYGSLALNDYDPIKSDLDFLVVLASSLGDAELEQLRQLHIYLCREYPLGHRMEGHYVPLPDIQAGKTALTDRYPSVNGENIGMQGVVILYWYQLHTCGIRVCGPGSAALFPPVEWEQVQREMDYNLNVYWHDQAQKYGEKLLQDSEVDFAVLSLCRICYTLEHRSVTSKSGAGQWALDHLPTRWHPVIREGLRIRLGAPRRSYFRSRRQRTDAVHAFYLAIREQCNQRFSAGRM